MSEQAMTTAGLQAKVRLRQAWFEAHPNQPVPEGRAEVERLFVAIEAEAIPPPDEQQAGLRSAIEAFFAVPRPPSTDRDGIVAYELALQRLRVAYGVTDRKVMPCPVRSSVTDERCLLPAGHPQDSATRFHRYAPLAQVPAQDPDPDPMLGWRLAKCPHCGEELSVPAPEERLREAVRKWQAAEAESHVVTFSETGYGLMHPPSCRPDLIGCWHNQHLASRDYPEEKPGRYLTTRHKSHAEYRALGASHD